MKKFIVAAVLLITAVFIHAQQPAPNSSYTLITAGNIILSKNYYLLALLEQDTRARQLIETDTVLTGLLQQKIGGIKNSLSQCNNDIACLAGALKFSDEEIEKVSQRLLLLYSSNNALGNLVRQHLIPSGNYILFQQLPAKELLRRAWQQDAQGINFSIGVYAEGRKPNYPNIDSIAFNIKQAGYGRFLYSVNYLTLNECSNTKLFFQPSLTAALRLLEINERNQAADYEPMTAGENRGAVEKIKMTQWSKYKYSLIMIPGAGPEEPNVTLSAEGMIRCRLAALQYQKGLAPFIVTSGGKVHPYKTKICEALEMKKFMVAILHIPAAAIIIDPHARHTTTNMRNTVRLMFRYGIPFNKPALTCTTRGQSTMIETTLVARCLKELKEVPYKNGLRLTETELEFYPLPEALHINPMEPMDP